MKIYNESKLKNGLTIVTSTDNNSDIITLNLVIKAGSRNESLDERGYAHLLEHMLLKGTINRPTAYDVALVSDRAGAYLNATTGYESIRVIIQVAKEGYGEIIELLGDIIKNPLLDETTLENEKKVVIEEINKSFDNPSKLLWIESNKNIYEGHPLSNHPLGSKESVLSATSEKLRSYYKKFLKADNIALIAVGNIDHEEIKKDAEGLFGNLERSDQKDIKNSDLKIKKGIGFAPFKGNQTNLSFSFVGPRPTYNEDLALKIISIFLAGFRTSLLSQELRHKNGLVYGVSAYNTIYEDSNLFYIETSSSYPEKVISITKENTINLKNVFKLSALESYKDQLIKIKKRQLNDPFAELGHLNNCWILYGKIISPSQLAKDISNIKYEEIISANNTFLTKENLFIMELGDKKIDVEI